MPTSKTVLLYKFDELDDDAKEVAREWWRQHVFQESCDWELVFSDAVAIAEILGIEIDRRCNHPSEPAIWFRGFWSQGDGASYDGHYRYAPGCVAKIKAYAPKDEQLHRMAERLVAVQRPHFYKLEATCKNSGHYASNMSVEVSHADSYYKEIPKEDEDELEDILTDFAYWIYRQLEKEYDYQTSDEVVDETILMNEYTFTEDGERED